MSHGTEMIMSSEELRGQVQRVATAAMFDCSTYQEITSFLAYFSPLVQILT